MKKYFAPGRINLIGEHLDYNGGKVLPVAISLGIKAEVQRLKAPIARLHSKGHPSVEINLAQPLTYDKSQGWANYPKGTFAHYKHQYDELEGVEIWYESNLPEGSGLSSSAAIEVLTLYILHDLHQEPISKKSLALAAQKIENQFIGVNCGIMDQYAVANGKARTAMWLDCSTIQHVEVEMDLGEYQLWVMDTCKPRELRTSKYNERRAECEAALDLFKVTEKYSTLAQATLSAVESVLTDEILKKRARHVVSEVERVTQAVKALKSGNISDLGRLMNESHESLRVHYEVSGKELDCLVSAAQTVKGCIGARMTGAGFGGCAIALVHSSAVADFQAKVAEKYLHEMGYSCKLYPVEVVGGVSEVI